jgi:hypothetical protein
VLREGEREGGRRRLVLLVLLQHGHLWLFIADTDIATTSRLPGGDSPLPPKRRQGSKYNTPCY